MKNFVMFEIKGYNQEKFFNTLSKEYAIFDIKREDKERSFFKVKASDEKRVTAEIKENGFEILAIKREGFVFKIRKVLLSYGIIAGIIFGFLFYIIQGLFIRNIEVWGNEKINDSEIIEFIDDNIGNKLKKNVNSKELENKIFNNFDGLSFVSVAIIGQTIIVNIKEEIIPDEMKGNFQPIYSQYDALITEIELIQGTICVKVGDIIEKGEILVQPYIINSSGEQMPVKPLANIKADVWVVGEEIHNSSYQEVYRTGKKIVNNQVFLGALSIYKKQTENPFESFEVMIEEKKLVQNNLLPFKLQTTTYYQTEKREVNQSFEEVKQEVVSKARKKVLQKIEDCDIIKKEHTVIRECGNLTTVSYIITITKNIGA